MKELLESIGVIANVITWILLYQHAFTEEAHERGHMMLLVVGALSITDILLRCAGLTLLSIPCCALMLCIFIWCANKKVTVKSLIEVLTTHFIMRAICLLSLVLAFIIFVMLGEIEQVDAQGIIRLIPQILITIIACDSVCDNRLSNLIEKHTIPVIAADTALLGLSYIFATIPNWTVDRKLQSYVIAVSIGLSIILASWLQYIYKKQNQLKEEQHKAEELNARVNGLLSQAHKFKEIVPAIRRQMQVMLDSGELGAGSRRMVERAMLELAGIEAANNEQSRRELMAFQNFDSTGLELLDSQLMSEQERAASGGISFAVEVRDPLQELEELERLGTVRVQQILGDLYRNAVRAVQKAQCANGHIILTIGKRDGVFQFRMCDNGAPFPPDVLARLGERGVTEGGTGNGLADICEAVLSCEASIVVEEFRPGARLSTKAVSVVFDGLGKLRISSALDEGACRVQDLALLVRSGGQRAAPKA